MKNSSSTVSRNVRRRRASAEERREWVAAWAQSEQTQSDFARSHGLSVGTLRNWLRREGTRSTTTPIPATFVELDASALIQSEPPARGGAWEFEIGLPGGWRLAVAAGTTVERLRAVLEALRC